MLAIIGGTGIEVLAGLEAGRELVADTVFGAPSAPLVTGRLRGRVALFLQRHGQRRSLPPHRINYRANLWALREHGATAVIGINAVGGIGDRMDTGRLVVPDQLIDYTWGRAHTFDEGGDRPLQHVDFTEPYDPALRAGLLAAAASVGVDCVDGGVYGVTQGPRLETAAEIRRLAGDGCELVGMTGMPEAALARELGLRYASLCMVVNAAAGLGEEPLTLAAIGEVLAREAVAAATVVSALAAALPAGE